MANKKTLALTTEQYEEIIATMQQGFAGCRPNKRCAMALMIEGNLGIRISDVIKLKLNDIVKDGDRYRLDIVEQKTGKARTFTVLPELYNFLKGYCFDNQIKADDIMIPVTERAVQKQLKIVCDYLGYEGISTHSFRKFYATQIYNNNDYDIALVKELLQHSSVATTQRYIGVSQQKVEKAIRGHLHLM